MASFDGLNASATSSSAAASAGPPGPSTADRGSPSVMAGDRDEQLAGDGGANGVNGKPQRPRSTGKVTGTLRMMKTLSMAGTLFSKNTNVNFLSQIEVKGGSLPSPSEVAPLPLTVTLGTIFGPRRLPSGNMIFDPIDCMQRFRNQYKAAIVTESPMSPLTNESMIVGTTRRHSAALASPTDSTSTATLSERSSVTLLKAPVLSVRELVYKPGRPSDLETLTSAIFSSSPKSLSCLAFIQLPELLDLVFDPANESPLNYPEIDIVDIFVLNHTMFMATENVVEEAFVRFHMSAPSEATNKEKLEYKNNIDPIRRRAVHLLSRLITRCWHAIERRKLVETLEDFANSLQTAYKQMYMAHAYQLQEAIRAQRMTAVSSSIRMFMRTPGTPSDTAALDPHLMADRANAIADEITLMEQQEFRLIKAHQWTSLVHPDGVHNQDDTVRQALMPISWFVRMSRWVATEILGADSNQMRAYTIRKFIKIGAACREQRNFNSIAWIVHGLAHPAVSRLTTVWQIVPKKYTETFEELEKLVQPRGNFSSYRPELEAAKPPVIPIVGLLLQELTAVEKMTASEESFDGTPVVRFDRCLALYHAIHKIEDYQLTSYKMKSDESLRSYVTGSTAYDDESLMQQSRQLSDGK